MTAPTLSYVVEPTVGGAIVFQPSAPVKNGAQPTGRLMLCFRLHNTGTTALTVVKVKLSFPGSNVAPVDVPVVSTDPMKPGLVVPAGKEGQWGFTNRDDVILAIPAPATVVIEVLVAGNPTSVKQTAKLRAFTDGPALIPPFRSSDLRDGEYVVTSRCSHGAGGFIGAQSFAYDIGVHALNASGGGERGRLPGADTSKNTNFRIWGLPVYAMASGKILDVRRDVPTNPEPPTFASNLFQTGLTNSGSGNYVVIDHGNGYVVQYAHMQAASVPPSLAKNVTVSAGQLLGRVGNSGNSSGPHIHIDAKQGATSTSNGTTRPLVWSNGWVVGFGDPQTVTPSSGWAEVKSQGLPALAGDAETNATVAWWPSAARPSRFAPHRTEVVIGGIPEALYQSTFDQLAAAGYHVHTVRTARTGGLLFFSVVARPAAGEHVAFHNTAPGDYEAMFHDLEKKGFRLTCLHSYRTDRILMAGVFRKAPGPLWSATGLHTAPEHAADLAKARVDGFCPVSVSVVVDGKGQDLFSAIFEHRDVGAWQSSSVPVSAYQQLFDKAGHDGLRLMALDAHPDPVLGDMLDAVFHTTEPGGAAAHGLALDTLAETCHRSRLDGRLTRTLASYQDSGSLRFAGMWR